MKYTARQFRRDMPEWKRKKDPILSRIFYRPLSFAAASLAAELRFSANAVSYCSAVVGLVACGCFFVGSAACNLAGAVLVNVWLVLDCTDGNLARSIRKQPFGEFADAVSSYILVGFLCTAMGYSAHRTGGVLAEPGAVWIVLLGALASSSDTLMRLIYHKYKSEATALEASGTILPGPDARTDPQNASTLRVRIEAELGIGGILPPAILLCAILGALDLVVIYCFFYYNASFAATALQHIKKAQGLTKSLDRAGEAR